MKPTYHRVAPTTEAETLDLLRSELRATISACDAIARTPETGVHFDRMIKGLQAVEMCARLMFWYRNDIRWMNGIFHFAEVQERARKWLVPVTIYSKKLFSTLADVLRQLEASYARLTVMRLNTFKPILPAVMAPPEVRVGRPVQVMMPHGFQRASPGSKLVIPRVA